LPLTVWWVGTSGLLSARPLGTSFLGLRSVPAEFNFPARAFSDSEEEGLASGWEMSEDKTAFETESVGLGGVWGTEDFRGRPRGRGALAVLVEPGANVLRLADVDALGAGPEGVEAGLDAAGEVAFGEEVGEPEIEQPSRFLGGLRGGVAWGGLGLFC
jgi:hypothetical protein